MTQTTFEILILIMNALGAGLLMFIAGVLQKIMNSMDEAEFKRFLNKLDKAAMSDPFSITVATLPIIAIILYFVFYGFTHYWFIAGIIIWIIGSSITKVINLPIYHWVHDPQNKDTKEIRERRHRLQLGNNLRAWTTLVSVILMMMQLNMLVTIISVVIFIIVAIPLTAFSSRYNL